MDIAVTLSTEFSYLEKKPWKVEEIENNSEDDVDLARKLFRLVFQKELCEKPQSIYCTEVDGKEQLNLKGIQYKCLYCKIYIVFNM